MLKKSLCFFLILLLLISGCSSGKGGQEEKDPAEGTVQPQQTVQTEPAELPQPSEKPQTENQPEVSEQTGDVEMPEFPTDPIPYDPEDEEAMKITLEALPQTLQEFAEMPQMDLRRPQNTCAMLLCALHLYNIDKEAGIAAMNMLRGPRQMNDYDIRFLKDRMKEKEYLAEAYFEGATPENGYEPPAPYVVILQPDRHGKMEEGYLKLFMKTSGADSARPVQLRQKEEKWFLWEYSSILTGIRIPDEQDPWK